MKNMYNHYDNVTREILDSIKVGDMIKINDWETPMCVKAVSENYFVMTSKEEEGTFYSVCSKLPWNAGEYNKLVKGMFYCGCDNWIFGYPLTSECDNLYDFENEKYNQLYLQDFEDENSDTEISVRNSIAIYDLFVKAN